MQCLISLLPLFPNPQQPFLCSSQMEDLGKTDRLRASKSPPAGLMVLLLFSGSLGNLATWDQVCKEVKETHPRITHKVGVGELHM